MQSQNVAVEIIFVGITLVVVTYALQIKVQNTCTLFMSF